MLGRLGLGGIGWLATACILAAIAAIMVLAAPDAAAGGEEQYTATFPTECVVGAGSLNIVAKERFTVTVSAVGPVTAGEGEEFSFHEASVTLEAPRELSEAFHDLGATELKGHVTSLILDNSGAEPTKLNIAKPPEYPTGLPFVALVGEETPSIVHIPSKTLGETGLTYSFGPLKMTGSPGEAVSTIGSTPGFIELEPGHYRETGEGFVSEVEGAKSGEHVIGPLTTACNIPAGITFAKIALGPPPPPECLPGKPEVKGVSPSGGPFMGGTTVTIKGCNFTGATAVEVGGVPVRSFTVNSNVSITAVTPAAHGPEFLGVVVVTTPAGASSSTPNGPNEFEYFRAQPTITSIEPNQGPTTGGTKVTIHGNEFDEVIAVRFGEGVAAGWQIDSDDEITATSPPGSGTVEVVVTDVPNSSGPTPGDRFTYVPAVEKAELKGWALSGTLTPKKLAQTITLPSGSTFDGNAEVNPETGAGSVTGSFSIPAFSAPLKLFGVAPLTLGVSLTEAGPLEGTLAKSETTPGDELLKIPAKLELGVTSVKVLGVSIPTKCSTVEPLALALSDTLTREGLLKQGWGFAGKTSIPRVKCEGGFLGALFGDILTTLVSGPESPYALEVTAP